MSIYISGSVAYDNIMVFDGQFKQHILPDRVHMLNVSFLAPTLRREFGGCAGNIAYNLALLGETGVVPLAAVGQDFAPYRAWFTQCGIEQRGLIEQPDSYTAQAYIITDLDDNQITAFHPGAMNLAHQLNIPANEGIELGLLSPNGREAMLKHARQFNEANIPFLFDPGQGLPLFSGDELRELMTWARWVAVNDYELQLILERTGMTEAHLATEVEALIVTMGAHGSRIHTQGRMIEIPSTTATAVIDPTGCGDAYRAGIIYGIRHHLDWETTGRLGALLGALKIARPGTQNHRFTMTELRDEFCRSFGCPLPRS